MHAHVGRRLALIAGTKDGAFLARLSNDAPRDEAKAMAEASHHISDYLRRSRELLEWIDGINWRLLMALAAREDNDEFGLLEGGDSKSSDGAGKSGAKARAKTAEARCAR